MLLLVKEIEFTSASFYWSWICMKKEKIMVRNLLAPKHWWHKIYYINLKSISIIKACEHWKFFSMCHLKLGIIFLYFYMKHNLPCYIYFSANFTIISYSTPDFLYVIIPLSIVYLLLQRCYIKSRRQLKRLSSISKSPILSHFTGQILSIH